MYRVCALALCLSLAPIARSQMEREVELEDLCEHVQGKATAEIARAAARLDPKRDTGILVDILLAEYDIPWLFRCERGGAILLLGHLPPTARSMRAVVARCDGHQEEALVTLRRFGARAHPHLKAALTPLPAERRRELIYRALGQIADVAFETLIEALRREQALDIDPNDSLEHEVASELARTRRHRTRLLGYLEDDDISYYVGIALEEIGPAVIPLALARIDARVRGRKSIGRLLTLLAALGYSPYRLHELVRYELRRSRASGIACICAHLRVAARLGELEPSIIEVLGSRDPARDEDDCAEDTTTPEMLWQLRDRPRAVNFRVGAALQRLALDRSRPPAERAAALRVIAQQPHVVCRHDALLDLIEERPHPEADIRRAVIELMGKLGRKAAGHVPALLGLILRDRTYTRIVAIEASSELGIVPVHRCARVLLRAARTLRPDDRTLRSALRRALCRLLPLLHRRSGEQVRVRNWLRANPRCRTGGD